MHNTSRNVVVATLMFMLMAGANAAHATVELVQFSVKEGKSFVCKGRSILPEDFYILTDPPGHEGEVSVSIPGTTTVGSKIATATLNNKTLPATYEVVTEHTEQLAGVYDDSDIDTVVDIIDHAELGSVSGTRYQRLGTMTTATENFELVQETGFSTCGGAIEQMTMQTFKVGGSISVTLGAIKGKGAPVWSNVDTKIVSHPASPGRRHNIKSYNHRVSIRCYGENLGRQSYTVVLGTEFTQDWEPDGTAFGEDDFGYLTPESAVQTSCCN